MATYDENLTLLADTFDESIKPEKIERNDSNFAYKLFNAISKTQERVESLFEATQTPFNPKTCNDIQLQNLENITQIKKIQGKQTGLLVYAQNTGDNLQETLASGIYLYNYNGEEFIYELANDIVIQQGTPYAMQFFMSTELKAIRITAQSDISITREDEASIADGIVFSCLDNISLQGRAEETNTEYRARLLEYNNNISPLLQVKREIEALPYVISVELIYNNKVDENLHGIAVVNGAYTIQPFQLLVCISGQIKKEIADIIYNNLFYFTSGSDDTTLTNTYEYDNDLFTTPIQIKINKMTEQNYGIRVNLKILDNLIDLNNIKTQIENEIKATANDYKHISIINESKFYEIVKSMNLSGVELLNIEILDDNGTETPYLSIENSIIPILDNVEFSTI